MKLALFVNDSYFSFLLAEPTIKAFHKDIKIVLFSNKHNKSIGKIQNILINNSPKYFFYRSLIELYTILNSYRNINSIKSLVKKYNLNYYYTANIAEYFPNKFQECKPIDLGLLFCFDQIVKSNIIKMFDKGIINVHASRLPKDKGVSPALWAFARGDTSIWASIYKIDESGALDEGDIYKQFEFPVQEGDTAFSIYERICRKSGYELLDIVNSIKNEKMPPIIQPISLDSNYLGIPDSNFDIMLKNSKRKLINSMI